MSLSSQHIAWLEQRGIPPTFAAAYGIRSADTNSGGHFRNGIAIPYLHHGKEVTTKTRWLDGRQPKWTHPNGGKFLWNEDALLNKEFLQYPMIVTEGEWDALAAILAGYHRTVSVPCGARSKCELSDEIREAIRRTRKIVLCGDNDVSGREMNAELARRFGAARCYKIEYPDGCKDLNEIMLMYGTDAIRECIENAKPYPIKGLYKLTDYPDVDMVPTFSTGWKALDPYIRLWRGEFCVITGVPSHGKSRWALELMGMMNRHHQHTCAVASFEMATVPYVRDILREHFSAKERDKLTDSDKVMSDVWIESAFKFIDQNPENDASEANLEWIVERMEDAVTRYGVDWCLCDPWNQVEHRRNPFENELDYQGRAIRTLKRFARSYNCGVLIVAHPTKAIVDKAGKVRRPTLYDVSGSAHWANGADHGVCIWREDLSSANMLVSCLKSRYREGGKPGSGMLELVRGRLESYDPTQYGGYNV